MSSLRSVRSAQSESSAAVPKRVSRPPDELCAVPWMGNVTNSAGEMNGAYGIGLWSGSTDVNNRGGLKSFNCKKGTPRLGRVPKTPAATSLGHHLADHLTGGSLKSQEVRGREKEGKALKVQAGLPAIQPVPGVWSLKTGYES